MDEQKKRKLTLTQLSVFFLAFFHASSFAGLRCQRSFRMVSLQFAQVLNNYAKPCHLVRTKSCKFGCIQLVRIEKIARKAGNGGSCRKPARRTPSHLGNLEIIPQPLTCNIPPSTSLFERASRRHLSQATSSSKLERKCVTRVRARPWHVGVASTQHRQANEHHHTHKKG